VGRLPIAASTSTTVTVDGRELVVFAGCDYLSLSHHPRVLAAMESGLREFGLSSAASRETTGNTIAHDELEQEIARFLGTEAALLTPDGYLSNLIAAQGLPDPIETVLIDRESHVSVRDALAATGHEVKEFALADAAHAATMGRELGGRAFAIFTDGVFPVLRTIAPIRELLELLPDDGVLVVDDSHGTGIVGARGRGSVELAGLADPRVLITGTLSKALGCFGGFVAGTKAAIERTRERSHAQIGSTPIPPAIARAASAALRVIDEEPERRQRLQEHVELVRALFSGLEIPVASVPLPVFTFQLRSPDRADVTEQMLLERGLLVPWVHYPDGLGGYFRIALRSDHTGKQIDALVRGLREVLA
jgi:7-keto-8-aminopelargonate synthetase-like enzyme